MAGGWEESSIYNDEMLGEFLVLKWDYALLGLSISVTSCYRHRQGGFDAHSGRNERRWYEEKRWWLTASVVDTKGVREKYPRATSSPSANLRAG